MTQRIRKTKIRTRIYTAYVILIFILLCCIFVPLLLILCLRISWHHVALKAHTLWAQTFFHLVFIKVEVERRFTPDPSKQYIFCSNHFSYLDIPAILLIAQGKFIGKSSVARIPVFGYFYRKIHITVNRSSLSSRARSLKNTRIAIDSGFSVLFFPEGGIVANEESIPSMSPFKDGAFKLSVEKKIPIIPVTMPYNNVILPDSSPISFHRHVCKLVIHEPVLPNENSGDEIERLKSEVFNVIQQELNTHHQEKVKSVG